MAAGNRPDAVGHGDDGEAEGACDAEQIDRLGPEPMLPTTAAPQPKNTRAKVPMNSASCLFIERSLNTRWWSLVPYDPPVGFPAVLVLGLWRCFRKARGYICGAFRVTP